MSNCMEVSSSMNIINYERFRNVNNFINLFNL